MKKRVRIIIALLAAIIMCVSLTACSAGGAANNGSYIENPGKAPEDMEIPASDKAVDDSVNGLIGNPSRISSQQTGRKLVYKASFDISTYEFDADYQKIVSAAADTGGHVESEYTYGTKPEAYGAAGRSSELVLRVPADKYDYFTGLLSGIGKVTSKRQSADDISEDYYDNDARIEMYEKRYERLKEYLAKAETVEDAITIEREISQVLYDLDSLKGTKRHYDELVDLCTISVNLNEIVKPSEVAVSEDDFGTRAGDAFNASLKGVGAFFEGFALFMVAAAPVLIVLAVITAIVLALVFGIRAISRNAKKKAADRKNNTETVNR